MLNNRFLKITLVIIIFFSLMHLVNESDNYIRCKYEKYFYNLEFEGVITRKYLDRSQHSIPIIEVVQNNNKLSVSFSGELSGMFDDRLEVGDSVKKEFKDLKIFIKNGEGLRYVDIPHYNCDSVLYNKEEKRYGFLYSLF